MKTLFKGGTVVSSNGAIVTDLLVDGEVIVAMGQNLKEAAVNMVDVTGKYLLPGFIDGHTHFDLDVCNTTTADDYATGSQSALRGGTTMVVDFATPNKGETLAYGLELWHKKAAGKTACDYSFHMTIDDWNDNIERELSDMVEAGITSFKMYMTYPAMMVGDCDMFRALQSLKKLGCIAGVHCENSGVIDALVAQEKAAGNLVPSAHPKSRPSQTEAEAVSRYLRMAELADTPVIIVHLSTAEALQEVEIARKRGQTVFVETCPHYLFLNDSAYDQPYVEASKFICAPPLRKAKDQDALVSGLQTGAVNTVATDHCSFNLAQKAIGQGDFTTIPGGMPGVETRGTLLYSQLVAKGKLTLPQMVAVLSENPAKLYGMFPQKGILTVGSHCDMVVFDPTTAGTLTAKDLIANVEYTPFEGFETAGTIDQVYLRGQLVVDGGTVLKTTNGKFIHRGKPQI
ncbi:MAG: dihydropyrimidinase [Eubacteriales bacterium]